MSKKMTVMKFGGSPFRRTVRKDGEVVLDKAGNPHVLVFNPGQPVELTAEEFEAVSDDIGNVLHIAKPVEGKPVHKPDGVATAKFVKERDEAKVKAAQEAAAEAKKPAKAPLAAAHTGHHRGDHETKDK